jgi:hypothetical protein
VAPAGWCQVEIVDVRGRLVARLLDGPWPAAGALVWDGGDEAGQAQPSGIYLAVVRVDGQTMRRKIALIR